jgi:hypothetical protein
MIHNLKLTLVGVVTSIGLVVAPITAGPALAVEPDPTCSYDPGTHVMTIEIPGAETSAFVARAGDDKLLFNADHCVSSGGTPASVTNVRLIRVRGAVNDQALIVDLRGGAFEPGYGDEPGASDEIEWDVSLGTGLGTVHVIANDAGSRVRLGSRNGEAQVNLNADEGTGIDADLTIPDATQLSFAGGIGNDVASGQGGKGTGQPVDVGLYLEDNQGGDDVLIGGDRGDDIVDYESADLDRLRGGAGRDYMYSVDGDPDTMTGNRGDDECQYDAVDTVRSCEA